MFRTQQQYIESDETLKLQIIAELKEVLTPCYEAFLGRVNQSSLSNDASLIKYPQRVMEGMLDKMFTGKVLESKSKKNIFNKLKV